MERAVLVDSSTGSWMVFSCRRSNLASAGENRDVLIETFHGFDHRLVPIPRDRYERASILSTDSFLVNAGGALEQIAERQWWHAKTSRVLTCVTTGARPPQDSCTRHARLARRARREGSRSEIRSFRNLGSRTSDRTFFACRAPHAPRSVTLANCFSTLL